MVKNPPVRQDTWVWSLDQEDPLEKGMTTYSSILAWRTPWTEDLAGYSSWGHKQLDMTEEQTLSVSQVVIQIHTYLIMTNKFISDK